ncbi:mammalian cell entry protein (plasmid) [Rhodococcus oxybenzonivorans]|uniref:Mammalian cell entry protein n=1 Tax=Rhodococcus oxybenzonivorans TaxID=1990687 RepID=A0A2S2C6T5_9NOCA|nr:MCE family protein [Rhodococcus oxybenzonivorans]AWK76523.1 mammalian cell entry protein [Rhodococcus oxybenzonivorans]
MKVGGSIIKFSVFALVMIVIAGGLVVVFGQMRFDSQNGYKAVFSNVSGLRTGEFVQIAGVEVGKVDKITIVDNTQAEVEFSLDREVSLMTSTRASVRWSNLIGDHYLELIEGTATAEPLPVGGTIPIENTSAALDLDALLGGFKPLFKALDPDQVNRLSSSLITVFQGQGGSIADVLNQTAQLTGALADRDQLIGSVITNFNTVLRTVDRHNEQFSQGIDNLQQLVSGLAQQSDPIANSLAHINDASATVASLLGQVRPNIVNDVHQLDRTATQINSDSEFLDSVLGRLPTIYQKLSRLGLYGDFFSFYICDATLKVNGPDGNPVLIPIVGQRAGRCAV